MSETLKPDYASLRFLINAFAAWIVCALLSISAASIIVIKARLPGASLGYISSALSFLCAFFAGIFAARSRRTPLLYSQSVCSGGLIIFLLTLGFIIDGENISPDKVLSLVSFTIAGVFSGGLLLGSGTGKKKKRKFELT